MGRRSTHGTQHHGQRDRLLGQNRRHHRGHGHNETGICLSSARPHCPTDMHDIAICMNWLMPRPVGPHAPARGERYDVCHPVVYGHENSATTVDSSVEGRGREARRSFIHGDTGHGGWRTPRASTSTYHKTTQSTTTYILHIYLVRRDGARAGRGVVPHRCLLWPFAKVAMGACMCARV